MEMKLDFRPGHEVFRRWLGGALAWRSNNVDVNMAVRLNQAMAFLLLVMALLVPIGFGVLARQQHHIEYSNGTVLDGLWESPQGSSGNQLRENGNGK